MSLVINFTQKTYSKYFKILITLSNLRNFEWGKVVNFW